MRSTPNPLSRATGPPGRTLPFALFLLAVLAGSGLSRAGDLEVTVTAVEQQRVELEISWSNAWRNSRNHDAVWLTLRPLAEPWRGILALADDGHSAHGPLPAEMTLSEDRLGIFVAPGVETRGDVQWNLTLHLARPAADQVRPWALEMVYIPPGTFELGDSDPALLADSAFYQVDSEGRPGGPYRVESEAEIPIGERVGELFYQPGPQPLYRGDRRGPLPESFPKGTQAFYVMKYELRQGEYARFLNALPENWLERRDNHQETGEESETVSIRREEGRFIAGAPLRPCNSVSWADTAAFADWMALRPMTEFEFEKAARGPRRPTPADYPWGTSSRDQPSISQPPHSRIPTARLPPGPMPPGTAPFVARPTAPGPSGPRPAEFGAPKRQPHRLERALTNLT